MLEFRSLHRQGVKETINDLRNQKAGDNPVTEIFESEWRSS